MRTYIKGTVYTPYYRAWIRPSETDEQAYHIYEQGEGEYKTYAGVVNLAELAPYFEGFHS